VVLDGCAETVKILAITEAFPPAVTGGYAEQSAQTMVGLASMGHEITVLSSGAQALTMPHFPESLPLNVRLDLRTCLSAWRHPFDARATGRANRLLLQDAIRTRGPFDVVICWHLRGIPKDILLQIDLSRTIFMVHDMWPIYERPLAFLPPLRHVGRPRWTTITAHRSSPLAEWSFPFPDIAHHAQVVFSSRFVQEALATQCWNPANSIVLHDGVEERFFTESTAPHSKRRLLFCGRFNKQKGVHIAVDALAAVGEDFELTLCAISDDPRYEQFVMSEIKRLGVANRVTIVKNLPRLELPELMREHDGLIYPSIGPESGTLGLLEGMASSLAIFTSGIGAHREVITDGVDAAVCVPGDANHLARQIKRVFADREILCQMQRAARVQASHFRADARTRSVNSLVRDVGSR
jgi:glycosyltransferase involved in cell wall biosynthesis